MKRLIVLSALALAPVAFAADQSQTGDQQQQQQQQQGQQSSEQQYVNQEWSTNQLQIQLAQIAQQKSQDAKVKEYAEQQSKQAQKSQQMLEKQAQAANLQQPSGMSKVQKAIMEELQEKQGTDFDRCYSFAQMSIQLQRNLESQWQSEHAQSQQVKQYAQHTSKEAQQSMQSATQIAQAFIPNMGPVNAGSSSTPRPERGR